MNFLFEDLALWLFFTTEMNIFDRSSFLLCGYYFYKIKPLNYKKVLFWIIF
jgi:hypothetical protein